MGGTGRWAGAGARVAASAALVVVALGLLLRTLLAPAPATPERAVVLTGGNVALTQPTVAAAAARRLGLTPSVTVLPAAGLVGTTPPGGRSLLDAAVEQDLAGARLLVLQGGEGDHHLTSAELAASARAGLRRTREALPAGVRLVLVGPIPQTRAVPASMARVDALLGRLAREQGVTYVSPVASGWTTTSPVLALDLALALR